MSSPSVQTQSPSALTTSSRGNTDNKHETPIRDAGIKIADNTRLDKTKFVIPQYYLPLVEYVMIPKGEIYDRIDKLALDIYDKFEHYTKPPVLVCMLKGAYTFFEALTKVLRRLSQCRGNLGRPVYIEQFLKASSYNGMTRCEVVKLAECGLDVVLRSLKDQNVVLVEDILDSGHTLRKVQEVCMAAGAISVQTAVLFVKRAGGDVPLFEPEWAGFNVPNEFVLGFGTDLNEHFRDLEHLCAISPLGRERYMSASSM